MFARSSVYLTYAAAFACGTGGIVMSIIQFVEWLQSGNWPSLTLLGLAIDWDLIPTGWAQFPTVANVAFGILHAIPISVALLVLCPLLWALAAWLRRST